MKRKLFALAIIMSLVLPQAIVFADDTITFDEENSIVKVKYDADDYSKYKVQIKKGVSKYNYNLFDNDEVFPLQMGSGSYTVTLYKNTTGSKYMSVDTKTQNLDLEENTVFLQSIQIINWSDKDKAIALAKELGLDKTTDQEKFQEIYDEIVKNIVYDNYKAQTVSTRYLPVIDKTYIEKKGICYDYSALMASMLRSLKIPTKMIHGYAEPTGNTYHAWNEVFLNGEWVVIDTTIDAQLFSWGNAYQVEKSKTEYTGKKEF